jgi:hypothetical protein
MMDGWLVGWLRQASRNDKRSGNGAGALALGLPVHLLVVLPHRLLTTPPAPIPTPASCALPAGIATAIGWMKMMSG